MRLFENTRRLSWLELLFAMAIGGFGAFLSSFVLFGMSKLWFMLIIAALVCGIACLLVKDLPRFWLAVLLGSIPIKLGKIFANPVAVQQYVAVLR